MRSIFPLLLILTACAGTPKNRPMGEMHGACDNYEMDLRKELELWSSARAEFKTDSPETLPLARPLTLRLVKGDTGAFGGTFKVKPEAGGQLRVAAGSKVWIDLVDEDTKRTVKADTFEMQTACPKIFKVVAFPVRPGGRYALQVGKSATEDAAFLLTEPGAGSVR